MGLEAKQDKVGNIVITKPATPGKENIPTVILQSHVDMVCEKNSDVTHDFDNNPIETIIDGDWIKANGTTLGADNGIGVAAQLLCWLPMILVTVKSKRSSLWMKRQD
jgi:dipeptidase D